MTLNNSNNPDSSSGSELTGKRQAIYQLCRYTNDNAATIAKKADTTVPNVYKEVTDLKKEGWLPADFTLKNRDGSSSGQNAQAEPGGQSSEHASVHMKADVDPSSQGRKKQQKSIRVRIWRMLEKSVPDSEIIMSLDVDPEDFRRCKSEYLQTKGLDSLARLYETQEAEIDSLIELGIEMKNKGMIPSKFVECLSYIPRLIGVKDELQRDKENQRNVKAELEKLNRDRWIIRSEVNDLKEDNEKLYQQSLRREAEVKRLMNVEAQLKSGIAALEKKHVYEKVMEYITEPNGSGIVHDEVFLRTMIEVNRIWLEVPEIQSQIKKLREHEKNKDKEGVSRMTRKLMESWALTFAMVYEFRNPSPVEREPFRILSDFEIQQHLRR